MLLVVGVVRLSVMVNGFSGNGHGLILLSCQRSWFQCAVWGPSLSRKPVLFQCDNAGVVAAIRKGSAKEALVMHLRSLWFFAAYFDIHMYAIHIPGACNVAADQLSWYNMSIFSYSNPHANLLPTPLPLELLQIVSMTGPDWTS